MQAQCLNSLGTGVFAQPQRLRSPALRGLIAQRPVDRWVGRCAVSPNGVQVHLHETVDFVFEQLADCPFLQFIEHVFLPSSLVALQLPPSGPGVVTFSLSMPVAFPFALSARFSVAAVVDFSGGADC